MDDVSSGFVDQKRRVESVEGKGGEYHLSYLPRVSRYIEVPLLGLECKTFIVFRQLDALNCM